ncbi:MAG TPA: hypothetical protein VHY19_13860 [Steroidobacteraceae bacterium]|jgi:hypothetical protein|nr:hypothetical protein [Steroidobacteraceae bacterium]
MPMDDDVFWERLGITWRASVRDAEVVSRRLKARLRLQSTLLTAGTVAGALVSLLGFALAAWTFYVGSKLHAWNFLTRGLTLAIVSLLIVIATLVLRERNAVETRSLRDMLQVSIARTERLLRAADLGCYAAVVLALGGMVGYVLRVRFSRPPAISPIEDLLSLTLLALALLWYRRSQAHSLSNFRRLGQAFDSED